MIIIMIIMEHYGSILYTTQVAPIVPDPAEFVHLYHVSTGSHCFWWIPVGFIRLCRLLPLAHRKNFLFFSMLGQI